MFSRGQGGILPERGSELQYDLVNSLVQSAMGSAGNSGSPILAALTPLIGGALMSRTTGLRDAAQERAEGGALESLYGKLSPEQRRLYDAANDESLPEFLRTDARARLNAALGRGRTGGSGGSGGGGTSSEDAPPEYVGLLTSLQSGEILPLDDQRALFEIMRDANATSQSRAWAQRMLQMNQANMDSAAGAPPAPPAPSATPPVAAPTGTAPNQSDPLGILNIPPA